MNWRRAGSGSPLSRKREGVFVLGAELESLAVPLVAGLPRSGAKNGVRAAIAERDKPFGDYSQAEKGEQPDPGNVVVP